MKPMMKKITLFMLGAVLTSQGLATSQELGETDKGVSNNRTTLHPQPIIFQDKTEITSLEDGKVKILDGLETLNFDELNKPVFTNKLGESVLEYSGLASDKNPNRSWAKATLLGNGTSPAHHHNIGTEDYYVTTPNATLRVTIDNKQHTLVTGDHIRITPGQVHSVMNLSPDTSISFLVKCSPAWTITDYKTEE